MDNLARQKRYTYADYLTWKGDVRYEIIDGTAYAMAGPSQAHQRITKKLVRQFDDFLRGKTCEVFHAPLDVRLNANSFDDVVVQPDIFVVCEQSKHSGRSVRGAPDLIIEILSPYNARHDTFIKFRQYQKAGVKEYWIADPIRRTVEVYILQNGKYGVGSVYRDDDVVPVHILEGCKINLAEVFYDSIEPEEDDESEIRNNIIRALKASGVNMSDEQVEKAVKILESGQNIF
ncbi:MAG: Uma2 family endonuclease [Oscillospiraceae bacterium]|nr:Uma2 family endonuclease [Oscillospiraceae bacterium]